MMYRYSWAEHTVGFVMALVGLCSMVVQGGLIGPAVKHFGETRAMYIGLVFGVIGFAVFRSGHQRIVVPGRHSVAGAVGYRQRRDASLMSRHVSSSEQGQLQGANASMMGIASLIGPAIFTQSFAMFIGAGAIVYLPGMPFLFAAVMPAASIAVAAYTMRKERREERMIVDAQLHVWTEETPERPWIPGGKQRAHLAEALTWQKALPLMDEAGIDRAIIVPPTWPGDFNDHGWKRPRRIPTASR